LGTFPTLQKLRDVVSPRWTDADSGHLSTFIG
jgi:hypothetical protein